MSEIERHPTITFARLMEELRSCKCKDDTEISFSGLRFYRAKDRGSNHVQIEFDELVYRDDEGRVVVENP